MARAIKTRSVGSGASARKGRATPGNGSAGWEIRRTRGLQVIESRALGKLGWLVHGFSTRPGGASELEGKSALNLGFTDWDDHERVAANRSKFAAGVGADGLPLVTLRQFHSDVIHVAAAPCEEAPKADAVITSTPGLLLGVQTADCVPILLADSRRRVVAAIHAGWRGTLARIAAKTLGQMRMKFGTRPRDIVAALGPAIGRCCYEVGPKVAQAFAAQFPPAAARPTRSARIQSLATDRRRRAGIANHGERSVHRVPHGSALQLPPRKRENWTTDGCDWN
jgi:YfiH family protein